MSHKDKQRKSFLREIAKDKTANTIAISAASLVPLLAMVGGGVDASRYYMAETRLQAACDAGALAARREMDDNTFQAAHRITGENFFDQNYTEGLFGTEDLQRSFVGTTDGEVKGTASGTIPTSLMGTFGYDKFDLSVECTADINISNTDITFVVDVTGSMGWRPDGTSCSGGCGSNSRLQGLRDAVMAFYDTVEAATSPSAQVRYGMVPYAQNANVGHAIYAKNPSWMATSHTYQSREGNGVAGDYETVSTNYNRTSGASNWRYQGEISDTIRNVSRSQCDYEIRTRYDIFHSTNEAGWTQVSQSGSNPRTTTYTGTVTYNYYWDVGNSSYNSRRRRCQVRLDHWLYDATSEITVTEEREESFEWVYKPVTFDLTTLYDDNQIELPTGWNYANQTVRWDGCVEEANTVAESNFNPVPAGAYDLDINLTPSNANEYWKPILRDAVWKRETSNGSNVLGELHQTEEESRPYYSCPAEAFRLRDISRGDLQTYVNSLSAQGSTYHDVGMIWGARFTSPNGIFASENSTAPNGDAIARHIVFMTDGELSPYTEGLNMYGVEWWDRRVTTDGGWQNAFNNHAERFQAACRLARQENISVWVVAFGTSLTQNLIDCATPGRAFAANDSATLESTFREIAQQIAALRLTQ